MSDKGLDEVAYDEVTALRKEFEKALAASDLAINMLTERVAQLELDRDAATRRADWASARIDALNAQLQMSMTEVAGKPVSESIRLRTIEQNLAKCAKGPGLNDVE